MSILDFLNIFIKNLIFILKNIIEYINDNISAIIFIVIFMFWFRVHNKNTKILKKYKRENADNDVNYIVKRCRDEGTINNGRNNLYLIDLKKETFHRINEYTLERLGYPRPPRIEDNEENEKFYFNKNEYELSNEIKLVNLISEINTIKNLNYIRNGE